MEGEVRRALLRQGTGMTEFVLLLRFAVIKIGCYTPYTVFSLTDNLLYVQFAHLSRDNALRRVYLRYRRPAASLLCAFRSACRPDGAVWNVG